MDHVRRTRGGGSARGAAPTRITERALQAGPNTDPAEHGADVVAHEVPRLLASPNAPADAASARVMRRSDDPDVVRRATVVDLETGEELRPLTIQELIAGLPGRVRRELAALPRQVLDRLAALPSSAQQTLLLLPEDTQLDIIAALERSTMLADGGTGGDGGAGAGAMVPVGPVVGAAPTSTGELPPDLVDFLMGRSAMPPWLRRVRLAVPRPTAGPLPLLEGPSPALPPLRRPDLSPEGARQRRIAYGNELATSYERPAPSGARVEASAAVTAVASGHQALVEQRAERERDEAWGAARATSRGAEATAEATSARAAEVKSATANVSSLEKQHPPPRSRKDARKWQEPEVLVKARQALTAAQQPVDEDAVDRDAQRERRADLTALRSAGLTRDDIDALITSMGSPRLHELLARHGAPVISRLARRLTPRQVVALLDAADRWPLAVSDAAAAAIPGLLAAGATPDLLVAVLKALGAEFDGLVANAPAPCVRLLRVSNLPRLKVMCQGARAPDLAALATILTTPALVSLLDCVGTANDLATLCAPGTARLATLFSAGVAVQPLTTWCRAPLAQSTAQLLAHPQHLAMIATLPLLAAGQQGPLDLLAVANAGADPVAVRDSVLDAARLLTTPRAVLQYFVGHPADTAAQFRTATVTALATAATLPKDNPRPRQTANNVPYTEWDHHAQLNCATLHLLLDENRARLRYVDTFETKTESSNGGDTEEYAVDIFDGAAWQTLWTIHLHRAKGSSKLVSPTAMHMKRWDLRKLKDTLRVTIDSAMAKRCRDVHP